MSIKYPETFAEVGRQNVTVAANTKIRPLTTADFLNGESPKKTYKSWSVLNLNFANSESKSGGSGAIEVSHLADVRIRTEIAMREIMENERKGLNGMNGGNGSEEKNSAAQLLETKVFFLPREISSDMRGRTAIEIARASGAANAKIAAQNLRNSANNNEKYKDSNLKQANAMELAAIIVDSEVCKLNGKTVKELFAENMDMAMQVCHQAFNQNPNDPAVVAATALLNQIKQDSSIMELIKNKSEIKNQSGVYKIYPQTLKTPNTSKVDQNGYTKAYSLSITCNPAQLPYPFHIELQTMLGKPLPNRQVGIDGSTIKDKKTFSIDLMTWEWLNIIERADWEAKLVALWSHNEQFDAMVRAVDENRQSTNNGQSAQTTNQPPYGQTPYNQQQVQSPFAQQSQPSNYGYQQPVQYY